MDREYRRLYACVRLVSGRATGQGELYRTYKADPVSMDRRAAGGDQLTRRPCKQPPPELLAHRGLLLGRRIRRRMPRPALGEERVPCGAYDVGQARRGERVCVEEVREEAGDEGLKEGEREGERMCKRESKGGGRGSSAGRRGGERRGREEGE